MKSNRTVWKKLNRSKYATFREHRQLISVLMPLTEKEYMDVRKQLTSKSIIELYKDNKGYTHVDIPSEQIAMLASQESFYSEFTDREFLLESIIKDPIQGEWIYSNYDRIYNIVGYTRDSDKRTSNIVAKITTTFYRLPIFEQALGRIGNPKYFMVIRIKREHINRLTPEGLKRMNFKNDDERVDD